MLILEIGILSPAPASYCWYIYDVDKGPIMSVRHSDCTYRSREAAMEAGENALARLLENQKA